MGMIFSFKDLGNRKKMEGESSRKEATDGSDKDSELSFRRAARTSQQPVGILRLEIGKPGRWYGDSRGEGKVSTYSENWVKFRGKF